MTGKPVGPNRWIVKMRRWLEWHFPTDEELDAGMPRTLAEFNARKDRMATEQTAFDATQARIAKNRVAQAERYGVRYDQRRAS